MMCVTPININGQLSILGNVKKKISTKHSLTTISIMMIEQNYDPVTDLIQRAKFRAKDA